MSRTTTSIGNHMTTEEVRASDNTEPSRAADELGRLKALGTRRWTTRPAITSQASNRGERDRRGLSSATGHHRMRRATDICWARSFRLHIAQNQAHRQQQRDEMRVLLPEATVRPRESMPSIQ